MTELPSWTYTGSVPYTDDLSVLEAALHSGRVSAAERGYTDEPDTIETEEAMQAEDDHADAMSPEQAEAAGVAFTPSMIRFRMTWHGEANDIAGE